MANLAGACVIAFILSGCRESFEIAKPLLPGVVPPAGETTIIEPNGEVIETPIPVGATQTPIEVTITGLSQAQTLRTLVRQLAR